MELFPIRADLVGRELPAVEFSWAARDVILYALGVGAIPPEELSYLDEARGPLVLPTFVLIPNWWAVRGLGDVIDRMGRPMVHASQVLELRRPLSPTGRVTARAFISGVWDKGTNTLIEVTCAAADEGGPLFEARSGTMILGLGGWGGDRGPSAAGDVVPDREPDVVWVDHVRPEQSAIYRLSGDLNRIHIDADAARAAGFADVFLHGLCTLGFAVRSVLRGAGPVGDMARVEARFASPVYLDQPLETRMWNTDTGVWRFVTFQDDRMVLGGGRGARSRVMSPLTNAAVPTEALLPAHLSRKENTRTALTTAALRLFALQGYASTTVDQIAAAAGVGQRTFFHHFSAKEWVLFAGFDERFEDATTAFRVGTSGASLWYGLRAASLCLVESIESQRDLFLVRHKLYAATPALHATMLRLNEAWIDNLAREIGRCIRLDPLEIVGPRLIASIGNSANRVAIDLWSLSDGEISLRAVAEEALNGIRPSVDELERALTHAATEELNDMAERETRLAIVTGGARGIGRAIVERLVGGGHRVVVIDINEKAIASLGEMSDRARAMVEGVVGSILDRPAMQGVMDELVARHGRLDALVNNAGMTLPATFLDQLDDDWDRIVDTNLKGAFVMSQIAARHMVRRGGGAIVHVSSISAHGVRTGPPAYAAAKAGVEGLGRLMAIQLGPHGVRVNTIVVGTTATPWLLGRKTEEELEAMRATTVFGRLGDPDDIGAMAAFLCSDDARHVTGQLISVSGGQWLP